MNAITTKKIQQMISVKFTVNRQVNRSPRSVVMSQLYFMYSTQKHSTGSGPNATELVLDCPLGCRSYLKSKQLTLTGDRETNA